MENHTGKSTKPDHSVTTETRRGRHPTNARSSNVTASSSASGIAAAIAILAAKVSGGVIDSPLHAALSGHNVRIVDLPKGRYPCPATQRAVEQSCWEKRLGISTRGSVPSTIRMPPLARCSIRRFLRFSGSVAFSRDTFVDIGSGKAVICCAARLSVAKVVGIDLRRFCEQRLQCERMRGAKRQLRYTT